MIDVQHGALETTGEVMPLAILLVAPDDEQQSVWRRFLQHPGCQLLAAADAAQALEVLNRQPVDIIIADGSRPGLDGLAFFEELRQPCERSVRILAAPTESKEPMLEAIGRGLLDQYLATPWNDGELRESIDQTIRLQRDQRVREVRRELQKFPNLPVPSKAFARIQDMLSNENVSLNQLGREIEQNPSFVARILQVANSVHFWTRASVVSVGEALTLIGTKYVGSLILGIEMFERVMKNAPPEAKSRYESIWRNALGRSIIARHIGQSSGSVVDPGHAHIASMLQDIALLMRLASDPKRFLAMEANATASEISVYEAEWREYGSTHDHLGAALLELWNFPAPVVVAVANQHWETFGDALTSIIQVADRLTTKDPHMRYDTSIDPLIEFWRVRLEVFLVGSKESANS